MPEAERGLPISRSIWSLAEDFRKGGEGICKFGKYLHEGQGSGMSGSARHINRDPGDEVRM